MRLHFIQHVPFEQPGFLESWAARNHDFITFSRLYESDYFPEPELIDFLVVLGGPMSVNDTAKYTWMKRELDFLEKAVKKRKKILGICLGAQMLARVLGGSVYRNIYPEIGWHPVRLAPAARNLPLFEGFPDSWIAFLWHQETFAIPPMGFRIAESAACPNQGFLYDDHVMALQFHMECERETVESLLLLNRQELVLGSFIQSEDEIRAGLSAHPHAMHRRFGQWLNDWLNEGTDPAEGRLRRTG
jgi:GMP synthase-like glutamine amidotransferase